MNTPQPKRTSEFPATCRKCGEIVLKGVGKVTRWRGLTTVFHVECHTESAKYLKRRKAK